MTTFTKRIAVGGDDGYSGSGGQFDATGNDVLIGTISTVGANAFYRFTSVTIPQGATILSAKLTFQASATQSGVTVNTKIFCNAADNATAPTSNATHAAKTRTTAFAAYSPAAQTLDSFYDSADFTTAVQEVINRAGWVSGNALMVLIDNNASTNNAIRYAGSYERNSSNAALLTLTYVGGGGNFQPAMILGV